MKVLIVSPCILPVPAVKGGAVLTLIESLMAQNEIQEKMELTVVGSYDENAERIGMNYPSTKLILLKRPGYIDSIDKCVEAILSILKHDGQIHQYIWKLHVVSQIKKLLRDNSYDRVVFQNSGYLLNVLKDSFIRNKYKGQLYYHLHNDIPENIYIEGVKKCQLLLISNYLSKKINKICRCDMGAQTHVVKNGLKTEIFDQTLSLDERNDLKSSIGIESSKKVIVYAGRITEYKGVRQLLDAFISMKRSDSVVLVIGSHNFGSGQTSEFEKSINNSFNKLDDQIIFTGFVPYEEMWKYYQLADVAVLPSMWEEPAGLTMIEAAASGVPVITTVSGGIPEYLNEELAIFVKRDKFIVHNIAESIDDVLDHQDEWNVIAKNAQSYVQSHFSERNFYTNFVNILK